MCVYVCVHIDQVVERDQIITEKEKLYLELKKILARQPGEQASPRRRGGGGGE
jgi:hypothetical protein